MYKPMNKDVWSDTCSNVYSNIYDDIYNGVCAGASIFIRDALVFAEAEPLNSKLCIDTTTWASKCDERNT